MAGSAKEPSQVAAREARAAEPGRCRCGSRLERGDRVIELGPGSLAMRGLSRGITFCSIGCVRAHLREALETLDALGASSSAAMVVDLRDLTSEVRASVAALEGGRQG